MTKALLAVWLSAVALVAQPPPKPANIVLANDKLELTVGLTGGRFLKLLLRDGEPLSPLATMGHFLALDGFGTPSEQERAAGIPGHGRPTGSRRRYWPRRRPGPCAR